MVGADCGEGPGTFLKVRFQETGQGTVWEGKGRAAGRQTVREAEAGSAPGTCYGIYRPGGFPTAAEGG